MCTLQNRLKQNPRLIQREMSDGRASLVLEYYLGRSESPVYDADGKHAVYESGAMKGKLKYKVHHLRKKEALSLYISVHPRSAQDRRQNRNTLILAEKIRFEKEQEMLEDRKGYRLKREKESSLIRFFQQHCDNEAFTLPVRKSYRYSLNRFQEYLGLTPRYSKYAEAMPLEAVTPELVLGFTNYLRRKCSGEGARKNYHWFKKVLADAVEKDLIKRNPCKGIRIVYDTNVILKEILSPKEIARLATFRYKGEHREVQRAFIFCCFTGLRYCDVSALTFANVDYESMVMRFNQKKSAGRSAHAAVVIPLNNELLRLIGHPKEGDNPKERIFILPHSGTARKHLARWVSLAGIKKCITWHCSRHSFAVNLLNSGTDIKTVSSLLGHASIKMTEKYLHVIDQRKQKAINRLGKVAFDMEAD